MYIYVSAVVYSVVVHSTTIKLFNSRWLVTKFAISEMASFEG